jgi:DNA-binding MarR family transcriptional regulator
VQRLDFALGLDHGLSVSSHEVLTQLFLAPEHRLRMVELANHLVLTRSGMTRVVERLERDGYVERCGVEHDRRGVYAVLTRRGFNAWEEATHTFVAELKRLFFACLGEEDIARLIRLWERIEADSRRDRERRIRSAWCDD